MQSCLWDDLTVDGTAPVVHESIVVEHRLVMGFLGDTEMTPVVLVVDEDEIGSVVRTTCFGKARNKHASSKQEQIMMKHHTYLAHSSSKARHRLQVCPLCNGEEYLCSIE